MAYNSRFYEASGYYGRATPAEYLANPGIRAKFDTVYQQLVREAGGSFLRTLDIGCGGSPFTRLLNVGQRVFADLSLAAAQALNHECFVQADLAHLPFRGQNFNLVVGTDVLEHLPDEARAIGEIKRVTCSGGTLLLTVPHNPDLWSSSDVYEGHFRRYTRPGLHNLLAKHGFGVQREFVVYGVHLLMRAVQAKDRKKNPTRAVAPQKERRPKTAAEFVLSDVINALRHLTRNKLFFFLYNPISKFISRLIMLDARGTSMKNSSEIGMIARKRP